MNVRLVLVREEDDEWTVLDKTDLMPAEEWNSLRVTHQFWMLRRLDRRRSGDDVARLLDRGRR